MSFHDAGTLIAISLAVVKTLILLVGSFITYLAFKAYRRTRQRSLGLLAVGFGFVTLGLVLAGLLYELLGVALMTGILLESLLMLVGFLVIAYSLYVS
ncbi:hypothetical protein RBH26_09680 [Natronolimnohabitans sp. A-GB9]|uniref:DUF7521 family protein n=1 Tax=Natronolimnohabitans sp. A-GB9 TaxID=3069757 RepID=UPI0027AFB8BF|nr:hypothetical protein [Natronolimnohabitans sp. A-GB9]MDQ2050756.1 hypothetical protein [Natronolimnohabitans sp. A-GB9]